jgi:flagellin
MGSSINTNISSLNTYRNLNATQNSLSKSLEKLSSGLRINRSADDAAGLTIATGLSSQVSGLQVAARNAQDGISLAQTADGALGQAQSILARLRDLAVQAANDTNSTDARTAIQGEADSLVSELGRVGNSVDFNGTKLLDGSATTALNFQVTADGTAANQITIDLTSAGYSGSNLKALNTALGTTAATKLDYSTAAKAQAAITQLDTSIKNVSTARASFGAVQNRFETAVASINVSIENLSAAKSRITDVDMASEMVNYTRAQVLSQAGTAMLAQANSAPQSILKLLG